jgi:hypothetical protein
MIVKGNKGINLTIDLLKQLDKHHRQPQIKKQSEKRYLEKEKDEEE